jgi:hypothetical protein
LLPLHAQEEFFMARKKTLLLCAAALAGMLSGTGQALADGSLTLVATAKQAESMSALLGDLADENVEVKRLEPSAADQAKGADYVIMVMTAQPSDPVFSGAGGALLSDADRKRIGESGGKKLLILRDVWKNGQEVVIFAGNTDADARAARVETKSTWWEIVASWFDIATDGMHGY